MSTQWALITGAGTGIGQALALALVKRGLSVFAVGRRIEPLQSLQAQAPDSIRILSADIGCHSDRERLLEKLLEETQHLKFLVHNAATAGPLGELLSIELSEFQAMLRVNVEAPLYLTQLLSNTLMAGSRILNISSGAAHRPIPGIGAYCISKAALYMMYQVLQQELSQREIMVGSVKPGVVETTMTNNITQSLGPEFSIHAQFTEMKARNHMLSPVVVGDFLAWLLLDVSAYEYERNEWDIYDADHHPHWLGCHVMPLPDFIKEKS
jgi:benzil reductase ((S)-benzoin forming)